MEKKFLKASIIVLILTVLGIISFSSSFVESAWAARQTKSELVRLTIENRSDYVLTLRLEGESFYYLVVNPEERAVFTPKRGLYDYMLYSCAVYTKGKIDLTRQHKMIRPGCSDGKLVKGKNANKTDLSLEVKIVKISIENEATTNLTAIFTGPKTFVFTVPKGETNDYTIPRGTYEVKYFACNRVKIRNFTAWANKLLDLDCP